MPTCVKLFSLVHVLMGLLHKFTKPNPYTQMSNLHLKQETNHMGLVVSINFIPPNNKNNKQNINVDIFKVGSSPY